MTWQDMTRHDEQESAAGAAGSGKWDWQIKQQIHDIENGTPYMEQAVREAGDETERRHAEGMRRAVRGIVMQLSQKS